MCRPTSPTRRNERGLSSSVLASILFPLVISILWLAMQWAMLTWAHATAQAAAQDGARAAAALDSTTNPPARDLALLRVVTREGRMTLLGGVERSNLTGQIVIPRPRSQLVQRRRHTIWNPKPTSLQRQPVPTMQEVCATSLLGGTTT